ncbi:MAG TPA: hypothetical protein VFS43_15320 [Polyangiaceae bacterium]|nr:hypothetical protein [Polyangiaceae bacterium]
MEPTVAHAVQGSVPSGRVVVEPGEARRSFEGMRGALLALKPDEVVTLRADPQRAAAVAHSVAVRDLLPGRRAVFERLSVAGLYDVNVLEMLPDAAKSVWYARQQQQAGQAEASGARVPEGEIQLAYETRGRMQDVLAYHVGDDPELGARLKYIREGSGHQDLANDLEMLADLYQRDDVRAELERDKRRYHPDDAEKARRLAGRIFTGFGVGQAGEAERWTGLLQRAVTLLLRFYDEHRVAGQFGFRRVEDVGATYPSLLTAVRSAPSRRAPAEEPGDGEGPGAPGEGEGEGKPGAPGEGEGEGKPGEPGQGEGPGETPATGV